MSYTAGSEELRDEISGKLRKIVQHAEDLLNDEEQDRDRQYIVEDMIKRLDLVSDWLDRIPATPDEPAPVFAYPMDGERG